MSTETALKLYKESPLARTLLNEIHFQGEVTLEIELAQLRETLIFFKETQDSGYAVLMDLTAVDYLLPQTRTKIVYWLHNPQNLTRLRIVVHVARDEELPSVVDIWGGGGLV